MILSVLLSAFSNNFTLIILHSERHDLQTWGSNKEINKMVVSLDSYNYMAEFFFRLPTLSSASHLSSNLTLYSFLFQSHISLQILLNLYSFESPTVLISFSHDPLPGHYIEAIKNNRWTNHTAVEQRSSGFELASMSSLCNLHASLGGVLGQLSQIARVTNIRQLRPSPERVQCGAKYEAPTVSQTRSNVLVLYRYIRIILYFHFI